ncbi:MAG: HAD family hydrolase [Nitrospinales bacterium]
MTPQRRDGLTLKKVLRFLALPFRPAGLRTWFAVRRFEDIPVEKILQAGIEGVLVDADGTLCDNGARRFSDAVVRHVRLMREKGLKLAIFTNADENRFQQFPGIGIVTGVAAKPDRRGFEAAMRDTLRLDDPAKVCMIGDNYITDGGAIDAGMRFIYVEPVAGNENPVHRLTRRFAYLCARRHGGKNFRFLSGGSD